MEKTKNPGLLVANSRCHQPEGNGIEGQAEAVHFGNCLKALAPIHFYNCSKKKKTKTDQTRFSLATTPGLTANRRERGKKIP